MFLHLNTHANLRSFVIVIHISCNVYLMTCMHEPEASSIFVDRPNKFYSADVAPDYPQDLGFRHHKGHLAKPLVNTSMLQLKVVKQRSTVIVPYKATASKFFDVEASVYCTDVTGLVKHHR